VKTLAALGALTLVGIVLPLEHQWPIPHVSATAAQATDVAEREQVLTLDSPELWETTFLYMTGHGDVLLSDTDVSALRRYLENGGFLLADDNYGMDETFRREIAKVFPDRTLAAKLPRCFRTAHSSRFLSITPFTTSCILSPRVLSDLGDGWEDPNVHEDPPEVREAALRMGVNLFVYSTVAAR
jgi:hypothetical protein